MKTIQEVLELVYPKHQLGKIKVVSEIYPSGIVYPFDISFLVLNFNSNMFGKLENCAERYIVEHGTELFGSSAFTKLDMMAMVYPKDTINSVDSALPLSHYEFLRSIGLDDSGRFLVMDYNNNMFGTIVNLAEKIILQKFIDGEKLDEAPN